MSTTRLPSGVKKQLAVGAQEDAPVLRGRQSKTWP